MSEGEEPDILCTEAAFHRLVFSQLRALLRLGLRLRGLFR